MKVIQILPELNEGGVERGVVESNREYVNKGIDSTVISADGKFAQQIGIDGGQHITLDVCSKNLLTAFSRANKLKKVLTRLQPDIIHVRSRVPAWLVKQANKQLGYKVVSTVHGFNSVSKYSAIMQDADAVICVSNSIKNYIQTHYQTPSDKITVIPRGIDLEVFNPSHTDDDFMNEFIKTYQLSNKLVVSSVGRVTQLKDYETFIKAIGEIKSKLQTLSVKIDSKDVTEVVGLIVGGVREDKLDYKNSLEQLITELNLDDNIIFTGSQSKVAEIYQLSDVVVSCSKKPESFGRSVAEAIAMNTPVIATNHGGVKDIIQEEVNGYFFEVGNANELQTKIMQSIKLNFDGYEYISSTFSLANMIDKTLAVYESVTA